MLIFNYITPVMFTDSTGYIAESFILVAGCSNPIGWILLAVYLVVVVAIVATGIANSKSIAIGSDGVFTNDNVDSDTDSIAIVDAKTNSGPTYIYRSGSDSFFNLTPRPGKDYNGLSYYLKPPISGSYTVTTIEAVNATGVLVATIDGMNHVSVTPKNHSQLHEWMKSREHANTNPHYYSIVLKSISWRGGYI